MRGEVEVRCEVVDVDVLRWRGHRHPRRQVGRQRWGWCLSNTCQFFAETVVHCYLIITVSGGSKAGPPTPCWSESKTAVADPKAKSMLGAGSCLQGNKISLLASNQVYQRCNMILRHKLFVSDLGVCQTRASLPGAATPGTAATHR